MPESYLVIGGSGLLGGHIIDQLVERGEQSVASFDVAAGEFNQPAKVRVFTGDICDHAAVDEAVKAVSNTIFLAMLKRPNI